MRYEKRPWWDPAPEPVTVYAAIPTPEPSLEAPLGFRVVPNTAWGCPGIEVPLAALTGDIIRFVQHHGTYIKQGRSRLMVLRVHGQGPMRDSKQHWLLLNHRRIRRIFGDRMVRPAS